MNAETVASGNRDQINPGIQRLQQTEAAALEIKLLVDHVHEDHVTVHCTHTERARDRTPAHESSLILPGGPQLGQPARSAHDHEGTLGSIYSPAVRLETDGSCSLGPATGF